MQKLKHAHGSSRDVIGDVSTAAVLLLPLLLLLLHRQRETPFILSCVSRHLRFTLLMRLQHSGGGGEHGSEIDVTLPTCALAQ